MYSARITRLNPTAFIILIDQSGSMADKVYFNSQLMTKAEAVAAVTNMMISELTYRCVRESGIANYFEIAALGYSGKQVESLIDPKKTFVKPSELVRLNRPKRKVTKERRLPNGETVVITTEHICWIEPKAADSTPMCAALHQAYSLASSWCSKTKNALSYPLTIFNITDGESSDGSDAELISVSDQIKRLSTNDGNVLLINIHICSDETQNGVTIIFPSSEEELPNVKYAKLLYKMSSIMPQEYNEGINEVRVESSSPPFRGMSFNTSITDLISMMNIGSMSVNVM